jgi:hypothetical protein
LIINYLLVNYKAELSNDIQGYLNNQRIAIKVFFLIPKELQGKLMHLIGSPELIIETLLINKRFDIIENIFYYFPQLKQDELITYYAEKAMSFLEINRVNENINNEFVIITKDIRENYHFSTAPDFKLFTKFMNLCEDIHIVARICYDVSNDCSKHLLEKNPTQPKIIFINFISKVLLYIEERLKICNKEEREINEIIEKLNFYEKLIELFKIFIYVKKFNTARNR